MNNKIIYIFCAYIVAIGLLAIYRTDSFIPLYINVGIAAVTLLIANLIRKGHEVARPVLTGWLAVLVLTYGYQAFKILAVHTNPRPGSKYIFASMAVMALLTLVITTKGNSSK